jgi:hypothetical protein
MCISNWVVCEKDKKTALIITEHGVGGLAAFARSNRQTQIGPCSRNTKRF